MAQQPAPEERVWHSIDIEAGVLLVSPQYMDVLSLSGKPFTINRVAYRLYGPLYWVDGRWSAHTPGKNKVDDPNFSLIRLYDRSRQGSHAAYRKAVAIIESAANDWTPSRSDYATLAVASLAAQYAEAVSELTKLYDDREYVARFRTLLDVREQYLATLRHRLDVAKQVSGSAE